MLYVQLCALCYQLQPQKLAHQLCSKEAKRAQKTEWSLPRDRTEGPMGAHYSAMATYTRPL